MFDEPRYIGGIENTLTAEAVLERCPWLWAVRKVWREGLGSVTGSLHEPDIRTFSQVMDRNQDRSHDIFFVMTQLGIHQVKRVPDLENHYCDDEREFQRTSRLNPESDGETIAERIIARLRLTRDAICAQIAVNSLHIPQIVIRNRKSVDDKEHCFIYELPHHGEAPNLLPLLLSSAPTFVPKWAKQLESAVIR